MKSQAGKYRKWTARLVVLMLVFSVVCALSGTAFAEDILEMSTEYPGRSVKAGETLRIELDFVNSSGAGDKLDLSVTTVPEGWEWYFSGAGDQIDKINKVYIKDGSNSNLANFNVAVPADAQNGTYEIDLLARGARLTSALKLDFVVDDKTLGSSSLTTEYPKQEGTADTSFSFYATLQNDTPTLQNYSFSTDAPNGWTVSFKPSGETAQVAAVDVDANGSQTMYITVKPPNNIAAGEYDINVSAISSNETLQTQLTVIISEAYELSLTTPGGLLSVDAVASKPSAVTLRVVNNGNIDIENINLASAAPDGWTVTFSESSIAVLKAGGSKEVTAYITPAENAISGDYVTAIVARTNETSSEADFRVSVKTSTAWGIVGIILILAVGGGLWYVFRKFGRR